MSFDSDEDSTQMSFDDDDVLKDATPADSYPQCSDDEARMYLYHSHRQTEVTGILKFPLHAWPGRFIYVDDPYLDSTILNEAMRDMLRCALPDWIKKCDPCPEASLPQQSKGYLALIRYHFRRLEWQFLSKKYGFTAPWPTMPSGLDFDLLLHRALSFNVDTDYRCATEKEGVYILTPSLIWTPAYDIFFEYIEHDVLRDANIAASFRPRWSVYPNRADGDEWPVVIPDVVFSVQIPGSESSRSPFAKRAHEYHPTRDFDGSHSLVLDVPLLLVEYNKCWGSTREVGFEPHLKHLYAGMTAALALYDALGITTPVFGLFAGTVYQFSLFVGVFEDDEPVIHEVRFSDYRSTFNVSNCIQMLHLYTLLANLQTLSAKVALQLKDLLAGNEADLSPLLYEWPTRDVPTNGRRVIDRAHPPLIVDDPLLQFLFVNTTPRIASWLRRGSVTLYSMPASTVSLPPHVQEWLPFFTTTNPVSPTDVQAAVEDCKKGLTRRTQDLLDDFWRTHSTELIDRGVPGDSTDRRRLCYIGSSLLYSMSACLRAQDLIQRPLNWAHSLTNRWLTLYRTLFTEAAGCGEAVLIYNHQWAVHRCLRLAASTSDDLETLTLDYIRPEMAFVMPFKSVYMRFSKEWQTRCMASCLDDASRIFSDLSASVDLEAEALGPSNVDVPISIVEYVLIPDNVEERKKHIAHLAVSMRSALAIWEMHQLASTAAVLGFLLDRNTVNVFVGYMDKNECIIQELSDADFIFDISKPSDTYRLFAMLRLQGSPDLFESVDALMGARSIEIFDTVLRDEYQSWKQPQRIPGGYYDRTKPAESHRRIDSWRTNVAKS